MSGPTMKSQAISEIFSPRNNRRTPLKISLIDALIIGGLVATLQSCKTTPTSGSAVLNNGEVVADPYGDPTVVRISMTNVGACTGTLVQEAGRFLILTAAHCMVSDSKGTKKLPANQVVVDVQGIKYTAILVVVHPLYAGQSSRDIALIYLDPSFKYPKSRRIGNPPAVGQSVTIDGFGVFSMSYIVNDDDGDGMPNGRDYCPNTREGAAIEIDAKGCGFDQWPDPTQLKNPMGDHRGGIRRSGKNTIGSLSNETIYLSSSLHNGATQPNQTQVSSGDSGGPLFDGNDAIVGVASTAHWIDGLNADNARLSRYTNITTPCNRQFIATGTSAGCNRTQGTGVEKLRDN